MNKKYAALLLVFFMALSCVCSVYAQETSITKVLLYSESEDGEDDPYDDLPSTPRPSPTSTIILGDVTDDSSVNSRDIAALQKYITGAVEFSNAQMLSGDINCDGDINSRDIAALQKLILA